MTVNSEHPDLHLDEDLHNVPRRASARRNLGRIFLVFCAVSIGVILASDPKVTQLIADTATGTSSTGTERPGSNAPAAENAEESSVPSGAISALSALSKSARSILGTGSQDDDPQAGDEYASHSDNPTPSDPARGSTGTASGKGGLFSFGSRSSEAQPVVSAMPQNRIPVRRAGISN